MVATDVGEVAHAGELLAEALTVAARVGSRRIGQSALEVTAGLCASQGDWENAAKFYGAAEAQAERTGLRADAVDEAFLRPLVAKAKHALGENQFELFEQDGRALRYEDALGQARVRVTAANAAIA